MSLFRFTALLFRIHRTTYQLSRLLSAVFQEISMHRGWKVSSPRLIIFSQNSVRLLPVERVHTKGVTPASIWFLFPSPFSPLTSFPLFFNSETLRDFQKRSDTRSTTSLVSSMPLKSTSLSDTLHFPRISEEIFHVLRWDWFKFFMPNLVAYHIPPYSGNRRSIQQDILTPHQSQRVRGK